MAADPTPRLAGEGIVVRHGRVAALDDVSLAVNPGETLGLVGPNGSGKTTLVRAMSGMSRPDQGQCLLDGRDLARLSARERARSVAFVGQDEHADLPFTAREILLLGRSTRRSDWSAYDADDRAMVDQVLALLNLGALAGRPLDEMSGGERQRVLIARALAQETDLVVLDEPTNHLDPRFAHQVMEVLADRGGTTVVVLHDLNLAAAYCDRVAMLDRGRMVAVGTPTSVLTAERVAEVYGVRTRVLEMPDRPHLLLGR